jgi:hypothetical protein
LPGSGIGSAIVGILGALYFLHKNHIQTVLFVNVFHAPKPVKTLIQHFLDISKISIVQFIHIRYGYNPDYHPSHEYKELSFVKEIDDIYHVLQNPDTDFSLFVQWFHAIFILKPSCQLELYKLKYYDICINIRRGDKITLESHLSCASVAQYIDEIEKIHLPHVSICHTSDEYNTFLEIQAMRPDWKISTLNTPEEKGYFLNELTVNTDAHNFDHVYKFIKQLHIMKNSTFFIGTLSTNVGFMVQLLRQQRRDEKNVYI